MGVAYIEGQVQRVNRNLLLVNGGLLALLLGFTLLMLLGAWLIGQSFNRLHEMNTSHNDNGVNPGGGPVDRTHPLKISEADLSEARPRQLEGSVVTLSDTHVTDLMFPVMDWMTRVTGKDRAQRPPNYHVINANGGLFVILPSGHKAGRGFTGVIRPLRDAERNPVTAVIQSRGMRQALLPFVLDCIPGLPRAASKAVPVEMHPVAGRQTGFPSYLVVYALLLGLSGWNVFKALYRMKNPLTHPIYAKLGQYGPPLEVARAIDAERQHGVQRIGSAEFTYSWLTVPAFFGLKIAHLDHIVWVFRMVSRVNFVPVLTSLRILERQGKGVPIYADTPQLQQIMDYITHSRPWIVAGYDPAVRDRFSQNRAAFIADVDARRRQYQPVQTATAQTGFPAPLS